MKNVFFAHRTRKNSAFCRRFGRSPFFLSLCDFPIPLEKIHAVCYNKINPLHILHGGDILDQSLLPSPRAVLSVDLARLAFNYRYLTSRFCAEGSEPIAVVKADAYGHGAHRIAEALYALGCRRFAVAELGEALSLRTALPPCEILVLGYTPPENAPIAALHGITLTVADVKYAKTISHLLKGRVLSVHIKLNSGMNRTGFRLVGGEFDRTVGAICRLCEIPHIRITGIYSHLACADAPESVENLRAVRIFLAARSALLRAGVDRPMHLSASAGVLTGVARGLPLCRLGLALYGYDPLRRDTSLLPVATLSAPLVQVYPIGRGEYVGYGATFRAARRDVVGILPIGYADGLLRALGNGGRVRVGAHYAPFIGRISMDASAISLRGIPRADCREAVIFGKDPADLFALAAAADTIPYELLAGLGQRIMRKYEYGNLGDHCTE